MPITKRKFEAFNNSGKYTSAQFDFVDFVKASSTASHFNPFFSFFFFFSLVLSLYLVVRPSIFAREKRIVCWLHVLGIRSMLFIHCFHILMCTESFNSKFESIQFNPERRECRAKFFQKKKREKRITGVYAFSSKYVI